MVTSGRFILHKNSLRIGEPLDRMLAKVDGLCIERNRLVKDQRVKYPGKTIKGPIERRYL